MNAIRRAVRRSARIVSCVAVVLAVVASIASAAPQPEIRVANAADGNALVVNGTPFFVRGMNWDYTPIGQNYAYSLWQQPDDVIVAALGREMPLLKAMGCNVTRQYVGIPPRWVQYIYETYGIFTVINHPMGRYGFTVGGVWHPVVDYSDPVMRKAISDDVLAMVDQFRGVPGVLFWLLGNENNYGLAWQSNQIQALPKGERDAARARFLYTLFGETITAIKQHDPARPVAMANGDLQYIDIIAQECKGLDIFGSNVYRGISAGDFFQVVHDKLGVPTLFTEFGCDAWNERDMREDQAMQAHYLLGQWQEIFEQSRGKGRVGNAIGGFVFQWSDGWWKYLQESRLDVHDTNASWPNGGYREDFVQGQNNMNEEWWGICAKGEPDARGLFDLYPRAAYYALRRAWALPAYAATTDLAAIRAHFGDIEPAAMALEARGAQAPQAAAVADRIKVSALRAQIVTYNTGGTRLSTPNASTPAASSPAYRGFDRLESFYADITANPAPTVSGTMSLNVLGNVPRNPIDEIFYENRGRVRTVYTTGGSYQLQGIERVKVYKAHIAWDDRLFALDGFYRSGHYHWGYEGDFFGLYREANYGANIDIYNGDAPLGVEIAGKRAFNGLKVAYGPQLWWGANPSIMAKYRRQVGRFDVAAVHQSDITRQSSVNSSSAVPLPPTRKTTLALATSRGPLKIEAGGIWAGQSKVGDYFQVAEKTASGYRILRDSVRTSDAFGGKVKLTLESGRFRWYASAASMGVVADAGPTAVMTFTGWYLKDSGSGNQRNVLSGFTLNSGNWQVGPNFLWQKPIVGPMPGDVPSPGRPRNVLDDPFAVRGNREQTAGEVLITYDPTPASFFYQWDNDFREDAKLAASVGFLVRHYPTTMDASIGILADGVTTFAFAGATPPRDVWESNVRVVSRLSPASRLVGHAFYGTGEPNGNDKRLIHRYGADARLAVGSTVFACAAKANDWGPYDYHRDFNLTYPVQLLGDLSRTVGPPSWLYDKSQTRVGVRATYRTLDQFSPRFVPDGNAATSPHGREWEIRTYLELGV